MVGGVLLSVHTHDARAVERRVLADHRHLFPDRDPAFLLGQFAWVESFFLGQNPEYLPIDAHYHDFEHTLQGTLTLSTLLRNRADRGGLPALGFEEFELAILAILVHDTGYLKRQNDPSGTGAKYTFIHVQRSCDFAAAQMASRGYSAGQILGVQNMIRCTGLGAETHQIPFRSEAERVAGYALGTADLVGQMAATDYPDKLPILFDEFREATEYSGGNRAGMAFQSAQDLIAKTPDFWRSYVVPKLKNEFTGLVRFLEEERDGHRSNPYWEAIEVNLRRLEQATSSAPSHPR